MTQEDKELLLKDLCSRLPYGVACKITFDAENIFTETLEGINVKYYNKIATSNTACDIECVEPYLRPMSSMTKDEVKKFSILCGIKDILSTKITDRYIEVVVDDGFCSTETKTIWYDDIVSSIEIFDWLNKKMFDYRGLIERGLALEAPKGMYDVKNNNYDTRRLC